MWFSDKRYWKQGVKLLSKPMVVGSQGSRSESQYCEAHIEASFDPLTGELAVGHVFS